MKEDCDEKLERERKAVRSTVDARSAELIADFEVLFKQLPQHQYAWIVQGALSYFEERIKDHELQLLRNRGMDQGQPVLTRHGSHTRKENEDGLVKALAEYRLIMRALLALGRMLDHFHSLGLAKRYAEGLLKGLHKKKA